MFQNTILFYLLDKVPLGTVILRIMFGTKTSHAVAPNIRISILGSSAYVAPSTVKRLRQHMSDCLAR